MGKLGAPFGHWEDSIHVLGHVFGNDPQGAAISIWLRCDVITSVCEQAPIDGSTGTSAVIDW